jgi:hypothetical protein
VGLLAAKERTVRRIQTLHPEWDEGTIKGKLIAYSSGMWPDFIENMRTQTSGSCDLSRSHSMIIKITLGNSAVHFG